MASSYGRGKPGESGTMKSIEEEMSRFEEEIHSLTQETSAGDGGAPGKRAPPGPPGVPRAPGFQPRQAARNNTNMPSKLTRPSGPPSGRPVFVPHQIRSGHRPPGGPRFPNLPPPPPPPSMGPMGPMGPMPGMRPPGPPHPGMNAGPLPPPPMMPGFPMPPGPPGFPGSGPPKTVTISAKPTTYASKPVLFKKKKEKKKTEAKETPSSQEKEVQPVAEAPAVSSTVPLLTPPPPPPMMNSQPEYIAPPQTQQSQYLPHPSAADLSQLTQGGGGYELGSASEPLKKKEKKKKFIRTAAGMTWEDDSLCDWDPNDFRLFAGDLGNEVTEDTLTKVFGTYPSFLKCKIVRDKRTNKTKGYGFVSFKDPRDFVQAMKDWNGKYVGNRPIKLLKSTWKDRDVGSVKKKQREKERLGLR
ncbi:uncharacterized protein [Diadema antillarum]|uniref:uncharacterized protein n=1 Tax=Diadema antillarum TaxID=105358 RepID=UPI003A846C27